MKTQAISTFWPALTHWERSIKILKSNLQKNLIKYKAKLIRFHVKLSWSDIKGKVQN